MVDYGLGNGDFWWLMIDDGWLLEWFIVMESYGARLPLMASDHGFEVYCLENLVDKGKVPAAESG